MRIHACRLAPLLLAAAVSTLAASDARACSPRAPAVYSSLPANGASVAAGSLVLFQGADVSLTNVTATLDGQPVPVVAGDTLGFAALAVVVPQATSGALHFLGTFCEGDAECDASAYSFTLAPADTVTPSMPSLRFDLYDHAHFSAYAGSCQGDSDAAYWVDMDRDADADSVSGAPVLWVLEAVGPGGGAVEVTRTFMDDVHRPVIRMVDLAVGMVSGPESMCFQAHTVDLAGHRSPTSAPVCKPCRYRVDAATSPVMQEPAEPAWTQDDIYASGPCGGAVTSSSSGTQPVSSAMGPSSSAQGASTSGAPKSSSGTDQAPPASGGCGCAATGQTFGPGAVLGLSALLIRRRARRASRPQ